MSASADVALVTGGSGELGRAICRRLAKQCGVIAIHANTHGKAATDLAAELAPSGVTAAVYEADLTNPASIESLIDRVIAAHGRLDILVNNAGIIRDQLLLAMSDEDLDAVIELNLKAAIRVTRAAAKQMMRRRQGNIINMSSLAATSPNRGQSNYVAAKAGLEGFTKAMAVELASRNIRVNAVAPGVIESEMTKMIRSAAGEEILSKLLIRRFGTPDDVAAAVAFLASADSSYMTGQVLHVDGGLR